MVCTYLWKTFQKWRKQPKKKHWTNPSDMMDKWASTPYTSTYNSLRDAHVHIFKKKRTHISPIKSSKKAQMNQKWSMCMYVWAVSGFVSGTTPRKVKPTTYIYHLLNRILKFTIWEERKREKWEKKQNHLTIHHLDEFFLIEWSKRQINQN